MWHEILPLLLLFASLYLWIFSTKENEFVVIKKLLDKMGIYFDSILFMILSKDNKGLGPKKNPNPDKIKNCETKKKIVVFVRHGESDWNDVFNKGINIGMISRLGKAIHKECQLFLSHDSVFLDSPLNQEGIEQALELQRFLDDKDKRDSEAKKDLYSAIRGENSEIKSIVVSSTLRRAITTTTLGVWPRLKRTGEKIHLLSLLQEISRNVDTRALADAQSVADLPFSRIASHCSNNEGKFDPHAIYDCSQNFGNKTYSNNGIKRLRGFNEWIFNRSEDMIIVGGHSLWFKGYFQTFLPFDFDHDAKKKKITNSGVVCFEVHQGEGDDATHIYRIDPESIQVLYGGFTTK